jgi:dipeptidyl aminopeptidase/acylaminoacyl peptidase
MVYATCLSPDGRLLATGEGDKEARIHLWDTVAGKEIRSFASNSGSVIALAFAPAGRIMASGSWDKTVCLWDVATGKELHRLLGHDGGVHSVCFSPNGKWLASASADRTVRVWEVATGRELYRLRHEVSVFLLAFSPDGRMLAAAGGQYTNDPPGDKRIVLWEMASGKERRRLTGDSWVTGALAFSPDGQFLASGGANGIVQIWEPLLGKESGRFAGPQGLVKSLAFSRDGQRLASGGSDTTVLLWDMTRLPLPAARSEHIPREERETLWRDLASADAAQAYRAMARLAGSPDAVELLKERLRPTEPGDDQKIARWVNDLDSDVFANRERATAELAKLGDRAEPALRQALAKSPSLEARRRIEGLLGKRFPLSPRLLFSLRAVEVLEHIGTPQARAVLQKLAAGDPDARLTREAKASLDRLAR